MGQAGTALGAATGENLAAIAGSHSLTEAVYLGALALLGLIGTEHCMTPPSSKYRLRSWLHGGAYSTADLRPPQSIGKMRKRATDIIQKNSDVCQQLNIVCLSKGGNKKGV